MKRYIEADRSLWPALTARVSRDDAALQGRVAEILSRVRGEGDAGLRAVVASIDGTVPADWRVSEAEFAEAEKTLDQIDADENLKTPLREMLETLNNRKK